MKRIVFLFFLLSAPLVRAQFSGTVTDEYGVPVKGAKVSCTNHTGFTDSLGRFEVDCNRTNIHIGKEGFHSDSFYVSDTTTIRVFLLFHKDKSLEEVEVIRKRMLYFDIGYLPPVRGVQIATGTSTIIQTETQGGAKSSANPRELFAKVPGLNIWESDGAGIQMGVGGRGLSPNRAANFNTRQNGYDISADALGYPESYYTPPLEALSSIEIIRGSAALQYGTQFGGLMNFVIRDPAAKKFEFTSRNTAGNFGYLGTFNRISGTLKRFEYQAYYQRKTGTGYRQNAGFLQEQTFLQAGWHFNENHHLRLEYTRMTYTAQQPGGLTDTEFRQDPVQSVRERNWFKVNWNILALHYNWNISKNTLFNVRAFGMLSTRSSLGYLGKINTADPGGDRDLITGDFKNTGGEARLMHHYKLKRESKGAVLFGVRFYKGLTTNIQGLAPDGNGKDFRLLNPDDVEHSSYSFPSENLAAFAENIFFFGKRFTVNTGVRLEYIKSASTGFYKLYSIHPLNGDTLGVYKISDTNSLRRIVPLGGAGFSFRTTKRTSLYGNFCMNYRAVNFTDIRVTNPNVVVDTLMRDEYGSTTELGWRGFISRYFYVDAAAFYLYYGNKIGLAPEADGVRKIRTNIGDAVSKGVELYTEFDFIRSFIDSSKIGSSVFANFSYIDAHYIRSKEPNYVGNLVEYVSPVILRGGLKVRGTNWQVQFQGSYNSSQFSDASNAVQPSGDAVIGQIPAYMVFDCSARYTFKKYFQLEAGVNNLLNSSYYTRRATAYPGPGVLPSDGRYYYLTLQFQIATKN